MKIMWLCMMIISQGVFAQDEGLQSALSQLIHQDPKVRGAAWALGQIKDPAAIPYLINAMEHQDPAIRQAAAGALGPMNDSSTIPALRRAMKDPDAKVRQAAAEAVSRMNDPAVPDLDHGIDQNAEARMWMAQRFGLVDPTDSSQIPKIIKGLAVGSPSERLFTAAILRQIMTHDPETAIPEFLKTLDHEHPSIRFWVTRILGEFKIPLAAPAFTKLLDDPDPSVRVIAAVGLLPLGTGTLPRLIKALQDRDAPSRRWAVWALGEINPPARSAIPALKKALMDADEHVQAAARSTLESLGELESDLLKQRE